jgi:diguanylate cyclase (GGDEF)-like protein
MPTCKASSWPRWSAGAAGSGQRWRWVGCWWRRSRRLRVLAMMDPMTGAASRLGIEDQAVRALAVAAQSSHPLSVLMLDIDHFKSINDRYGHTAGDRVLTAAAAAWQQELRTGDALGRIGGEEFLVLCPATPLDAALQIGERLREATAALRVAGIDPALRVSVSIGVAQAQLAETRERLFERVDAALYRAKQRGRDRVET